MATTFFPWLVPPLNFDFLGYACFDFVVKGGDCTKKKKKRAEICLGM